MSKTVERVQFIDFMRGFAVVVMVMGHSIDSVLNLEVRASDAFRLYDFARGFTAPLFLFISGFAFSVVTARRWEEYIVFSTRVRKRMVKMIMLLGLGYALHFPFFSLHKILNDVGPREYPLMFQVDVLHCVAVSILALQALVLLARSKRAFFALTLAGGTALVLLTPVFWGMDLQAVLTPMVAPYFNQQQLTIFPVFPFGAYLFVGALAGQMYERLSSGGTPGVFPRILVMLAAGAGLVGVACVLVPWTVIPPYDFWKAGPGLFLIRLSVVFLVAAGFIRLRHLPADVARQLVPLGQASLFVYVLHLVIVYGSPANLGLMQLVGQTLSVPSALAVALSVLMVMMGVVWGWRTVKTEYAGPSRLLRLAATNGLIYLFLTRPY